MSLRLKLLLLGLATLVLPWGGCQYAREMESALREGEQNSLQAVSQTIAASLQGRTDLLYREALPPPDAPDAPAAPVSPGADPVRAFLNPGPYDLKPLDRKSTRLNSSHLGISYAVFCLKKKK